MSRPYPNEPVLVVDDEQEIRSALRASLLLAGVSNVVECEDGTSARERLREGPLAAVVLDLSMPGMSGLDLLPLILEERPETPVIVATGTGDLETAVTCMRTGAFDYLQKPVDRTRLVTSVKHAIEKWEREREVASLRDGLMAQGLSRPEAFGHIVTRDPAMLTVFKYVEAVAPTSLPVLITGETGVGKELIARAIHDLSGRTGPFVPVNVAGLDPTLFADTLFGHAKGAYTGADTAREGVVAKAEEGTLFLDEIGDLAPESQIKLLRLLQEKEYYPLGTDRPRPTATRFVFATNLDVAKETTAGRFRKDLLYRLRSHQVRIPALRERTGDLPMLVDHFLESAAKAVGKSRPTAPKELVSLLRTYAFPGNVRELEGMVYDALVRHKSRILSLESFRAAIGEGEGTSASATDQAGACAEGGENPFASCAELPTLKEADGLLIAEALHRADGNQASAARLLGLTRTALNRRLNRGK
ncbi:MAG TPA: sigma-54 dependent transcriptional regulator [Spirochaetia bacterium]|nr:sigma-54 dependent transcriptional regulator [Spirochaetia bacterium]